MANDMLPLPELARRLLRQESAPLWAFMPDAVDGPSAVPAQARSAGRGAPAQAQRLP